MAQGEEKTEDPSELKLKQARQKGQVAKSADVSAFLSLSSALLAVIICLPWMTNKIFDFITNLYSNAFAHSYPIQFALSDGFDVWFMISIPILCAATLGGIIGNVGQFGFVLTAHPLKPDIKRISPLSGLKKIFSKERLFELIKQLIKFFVIGMVIFHTVKDSLYVLSVLFRVNINEGLKIVNNIVVLVFFRVLLCFLVIALIDWFWQKFSFTKSMKMSKYEVKKEYKQQEGDPQLKHERKRIHQEIIELTSVNNVQDASVVITNPSHVAVALKYKDGIDQVPMVIAKGSGKDAKHLIGTAHRASIPVLRNVRLARDLMWLEINEEIPEHLYEAVAEVLSFILELSKKHETGEL